MKKNPGRKQRRNSQRSNKKFVFTSYVPGTLGISPVSEMIQDDYGSILSRRQRKLIAKQGGQPFQPIRSY